MTAKAQVLETVGNMPDEATMDEIFDQMELIAGIERSIEQLDRGEGVPVEEVRKQLRSWISK
ncbi:MAG: hypothetical protein H8E27_13680 [Verrucomicrobia subdivision 3 bacterium]|nr:hypothetical protein [Limisphaerales bacterium]